MKPLSNKSSCDPISSNCVIWQGPDIECINLCKGDSISEVTYKLATELCNILDTLNIDVYDIACFNLGTCTPEDFKGLIQLLIERICANEEAIGNIDTGGGGTPGGGGCPDCEVTICPDILFVPTTPGGDPITTMQLQDYVLAIGNRVCTIIGQIDTINASISALDGRVTTLENTPPPTFELPELIPACVLPDTSSYPIDVILEALEEEYCNLVSATGNATDITLALQAACTGLNASDQLSGTGAMQDLAGWFPNPTNMSQSFSNLWKTLCDARDAVKIIQDTCCAISCEAIDLQFTAELTDPDTLVLNYAGLIPDPFQDNNTTTVTIAKADGTGSPVTTATFSLKATYFANLTPHVIDINALGIDGADDLIVTLNYGFIDPGTSLTCGDSVKKRVAGTNACPEVNFIAGFNQLLYSFDWIGTPITILVEILDAGNAQVAVQSFPTASGTINGVFAGLTDGTSYKLRLTIDGDQCDAKTFITAEYPCTPPVFKTIIKDFEEPEGNQTGKTIDDYVTAYDAVH